MQQSSTALRIAGIVLVSFLFTPGQLVLAGGKPKPPDAEELVISDVYVDESLAPARVLIHGANLVNGDYLAVRLGYLGELVVVSESADYVEAELPGAYEDGNYRLSLQTGDSSNQYDEFEITIGAVGPEGPAGPVGPPGPVEPDCELEERIYRAVEGFEWDSSCPEPSDVDRDGYAVEDGDCDDRDARAHPGQTDWFTEVTANGGYDWNCNGQEEKQYEHQGISCDTNHIGEYDLLADLECGESGPRQYCDWRWVSWDCNCTIFGCDRCEGERPVWVSAGTPAQGCH